MEKKVGIVAYSFGLREGKEPNPCNIRLAFELARVALKYKRKGFKAVVVSQWEITRALEVFRKRLNGPEIAHSVDRHHIPGKYLDSEEVMFQAIPFFMKEGITDVITIAQPFLQIHKCYGLAKSAGFNVVKEKIGWIGFDDESDQKWTRSAWSLFWYAVSQKVFGRHG